MGKHRKHPIKTASGTDIVNETSGAYSKARFREDIEARIGLTKQICMSCNVRNDEKAAKCRKCGSKDLRQKKTKFRD